MLRAIELMKAELDKRQYVQVGRAVTRHRWRDNIKLITRHCSESAIKPASR